MKPGNVGILGASVSDKMERVVRYIIVLYQLKNLWECLPEGLEEQDPKHGSTLAVLIGAMEALLCYYCRWIVL